MLPNCHPAGYTYKVPGRSKDGQKTSEQILLYDIFPEILNIYACLGSDSAPALASVLRNKLKDNHLFNVKLYILSESNEVIKQTKAATSSEEERRV